MSLPYPSIRVIPLQCLLEILCILGLWHQKSKDFGWSFLNRGKIKVSFQGKVQGKFSFSQYDLFKMIITSNVLYNKCWTASHTSFLTIKPWQIDLFEGICRKQWINKCNSVPASSLPWWHLGSEVLHIQISTDKASII